jgi:metal-responsive CopG/Arc/MetJ family transcriptional regulator
MVQVTLELPRDLVDWIDGLKGQLGFRSRGLIVAQLIRELVAELEPESTDENTTQAA